MTKTKIHVLQADIIFKALYYTARNEGIEIPERLTETYLILAEENPKETHSYHIVEVMEYLNGFIETSPEYKKYFVKEEEEEVE